jgi:hypothetical protein
MSHAALLNSGATVPTPDFANLPVNVDRKVGADLITKFYFPVSPRSLERWPLPWRRVNGCAITPTAVLLEEARKRFEAAPVIQGGSRAG